MEKEKNFDWLLRVIHSCTNTFQINSAKNIVELFKSKYQDEDLNVLLDLSVAQKYNDIHNILITLP